MSHQKRIVSEETRKKMSETHKRIGSGKCLKGRKRPKEVIEKIILGQTGEKSRFWIDGRSKNKEYVSWSKNKINRNKRLKIESSHTFGEWQELKAKYNWTCPCCKEQEPKIKLFQDHIIPLTKGGSNNIENIQPLCRSCNCKKHTKIIKY